MIEPTAGKPRRSRRTWVTVALVAAVIAAAYVVGFWRYATHTHDEFFDPALAARADDICGEVQASSGPPLPEEATFEERARRVEELADALRAMASRLRTLEQPGENEAFDGWLELWDEFIALGQPYADALRTEDPSIYEPAGDRADEPARKLNTIADANGMENCIF